MSKYSFIKEPEPDNWLEEGDSTLTVTFSKIDLEDVVFEFENFLRGAGFHFEGFHLDFVPEEKFKRKDDDLDDVDQFFNKAKEVAKKLDKDSE